MTPTEQSPMQQPEPVVPAKTSTIGMKELLIPISIVVAGAFIGVGFAMSGGALNGSPVAQVNQQQVPAEAVDLTSKVVPIVDNDWIKGSKNAEVVIIEYSDYDCPFCSRFHSTMNEIVDKFDGQVSWVYRHFPLEQLHPQAGAVAVAAECVGAQGGNDAFWQFTDAYFGARGAGDATAHGELIPRLALETGIDQARFSSCFENAEPAAKIQSHVDNAVETGGRGTPWSILIGPDGKTYPINGAQPTQSVEQLINFVLEGA